jgi:GDP-4-dehydro-6-deoxy-D-mannose reductase
MAQAAKTRSYQRILLTGGTGFVGSWLCPDLVRAYPDSERLLLARPDDKVARSGFAAVPADLLDREAIEAIVTSFKPDLVLHLAAQSSAAASETTAEATWRTNAEATIHLASALARHSPACTVFFVSTGEVYGLRFKDGPADETTPPHPLNSYARSKLAAEMALHDILPKTASLIVARSFNHTGPNQDQRFAVPAFASQLARIEAGRSAPKLVVGNLDSERDFLDVRDVSQAYLALLRSAPTLGARSLFNVASGKAYRISDVLDRLRAMAGVPVEVAIDPERLRMSDVPRAIGSSNKLQSATDWRPRIDIDETLRSVLDYQRAVVAGETRHS